MRSKLSRLTTLNRENAPHLFDCFLNLVREAIHSRAARSLARWWRVEMGSNSRFYGLPIFRRLPGSTIRIGDNCEFRSGKWSNLVGINRPCMISTLTRSASIVIGNDCGFSGTVIGGATSITLGARVMCGANVTITDTNWHAVDWRDRLAGKPGETAPVVIGDDVWLGMNAVVLKGVRIGRGTVVGAGSIVSRSLPEGVIAAGQPAVVIRKLASAEPRESVLQSLAP
jgi:acetyltransferase-like isoleucine patch superfamily enzyme